MTEEAQVLLDNYLADLHSGRRPERGALLAIDPNLAAALECLDILEKMAPPPCADPEATAADVATASLGESASRCLPSQEFGKYDVECELGRGGMGVVFKARQKGLDRPVALKMILSSQLASAEQVSRFQDEARAAARVHHPNIVAIYEADQVNGQPFFAMQFVAGPSLARRLRSQPFGPDEGAHLVQIIASAVAHLHENQIVHRDLKPANILLDQDGTPYVTDFGLVKMLTADSRHTTTGVIVGTPSYMSPEQASGQGGKVGPLSDVYSLGAILYEILTGQPPFREATPLDTLVQVLEGEPVLPRRLNPKLAPELEMICLRCLEKNPEDRYPSAQALAADLGRFLKNEEIEMPRPGLGQRLRRWARREPALAARLLTLAVCFGLIQASAMFRTVPMSLHVTVLILLAAWGGLSVVCQRFLLKERWAEPVRYLWAAFDVVLFSALLYLDSALINPVVIGYPLLIAASGLWFRVPLIWFTTVIVEIFYALLLMEWTDRHGIHSLHKHFMFMVGLVVMAFIVSYQVNRVRALSRYYEHRPLPK